MRIRDLTRGELLAIIGGILLGISLFLSWYSLGNRHAMLGTCRGPHTTCTGWASLGPVRYVLLVAAVAPAILAYIVLRGHALSWPRGELTAVVALVALVATVYLGVIGTPGTPSGEISINDGWWLGLAADFLILFGAVWRAQMSGARRKPPGVL